MKKSAIKKNFFSKFEAAFILDTYEQFTSNYTQWVYVYLKLNNSWSVAYDPTKEINISFKELQPIFGFNQNTYYHILADLKRLKLIIKIGRNKYYVFNEAKVVNELRKNKEEKYSTKNAFFNINNIFFHKIMPLLQNNPNSLMLYYYLKMKNQHYFYEDREQVRMPEEPSNREMVKELKTSYDWFKKQILYLQELGLVLFDQEKRIHTFSEKKILKTIAEKENTNI